MYHSGASIDRLKKARSIAKVQKMRVGSARRR